MEEKEDGEKPQDFGRKYYAEDPSEVHEDYARKNLAEEAMEINKNERENDFLIGPAIPKEYTTLNTDKYEEYIKEGLSFPITHQAVLKGHNKGVISLDIDPSGNRFITGGGDYQLNIYDFQGMNQRLKPFRTIQPFERYPITCLSFNNSGSNLLVSAGKNTIKIYTRDGIEVQETMKGDMYIRDMTHTRGHTEAINEARWNPVDKNLFMTISYDGTIRLWDLNSKHVGLDQNIIHQSLMKLKSQNGMKAPGNTCCYSNDGELLAGGTKLGGIYIWHHQNTYSSPSFSNHSAHSNAEISSLCFTQDSLQIFSRAVDNSMKVWDLRKFKNPLYVWDDLPNESSRAQVSLSPDEKYVVTASTLVTSHSANGVLGRLIICDTQNYEKVARINVCHDHVYRVQWQRGINQLMVGCGDGTTRVFYDPVKSSKGVLISLSKKAKDNFEDHIEYERQVITLDTVHKIKENKPKANRVAEMREDSKLTKKPEEPRSGRLVSNSLTAYIMTQLHKNTTSDKDIRETLLEFDNETKKNPQWVTPAYQNTQPKPIYNYTTPIRAEVEYMESVKTKKCAKCGQKFCSCNKKLVEDLQRKAEEGN